MSMGAESAAWELMSDLAIPHLHQRGLIEQLEHDFSAAEAGYRSLHAIADEKQRAVVSDQILQSAIAVRQNLVEARLHQRELDGIVGPDGLRFPEGEKIKDTLVQDAKIDMAITGSVRALGSALDCLAAVAIGVLRIPSGVWMPLLHRAILRPRRRNNNGAGATWFGFVICITPSHQRAGWTGSSECGTSTFTARGRCTSCSSEHAARRLSW
jgi:hypothetical protein